MNKITGENFNSFGSDEEFSLLPKMSEVEVARAHYRTRRIRDKLFPTGYFSDAGWEILLELYLCSVDELELSPSYLAYAAGVPPTTTLRYVAQLESDGYIERRACETDKRRTIMSLSPLGMKIMTEIMQSSLGHVLCDVERKRDTALRRG